MSYHYGSVLADKENSTVTAQRLSQSLVKKGMREMLVQKYPNIFSVNFVYTPQRLDHPQIHPLLFDL